MKNKEVILSLELLMLMSCTVYTENTKYLYDNGNVYSETIEYVKSPLFKTFSISNHYYHNGIIKKKSFISRKSVEHYTEYFPDGFPKKKYTMNQGKAIKPKDTGKHNGYDIKLDLGPYKKLDNGKIVRPFRTFVDGVSTDEYIVTIAHNGRIDNDFFPQQFLLSEVRVCCTYQVHRENNPKEMQDVEVDETMYPYYIEDMDKFLVRNSSDELCLLVFFYYHSVFNPPYPNDARMVVFKDSLNWEVFKIANFDSVKIEGSLDGVFDKVLDP